MNILSCRFYKAKEFAAVLCALASLSQPGASHAIEPSSAVVSKEFIYEHAPYPQAHASTIVELSDERIAAAWFGGTRERHEDVSIWFAVRNGDGWSEPAEIATGRQTDGSLLPTWNPVLFNPPGEDLHLFYKEGPNPQDWWGMVMRSADGGATWTAPERLPDGVLGPVKNKPVVLADGAWLSPSRTERPDPEGWKLHVERSEDGGETWRASQPIASPEQIDAIQPSILFHADGRLQMLARTRQGAIAMTWSEDNGKTWSPIAAAALPNPNSGTDAVTLKDGRQLIVYNPTAHRPDEPGKGNRYPLSVAVSDDGLVWREVLTLETEPLPSGYAYPAVIQASDGRIHITYTHNRRRITHVEIDPAKLK
ncbi:MAG: exo-alpha-sialidase [Oricola sp.]|nr:exo-alpha-sialidase [Oricola sp.]